MNQGTKRSMPVGALMGLFLIAAVGTPLTLQTLASHGYDVPTMATPRSLLALLDARSPGERDKGALTSTKNRKLASNDVRPHERALGKIIRPSAAPPAELVEALTPATLTPVAPAVAPPTLAEVLPKVFPAPGNASPPGSVLIGPAGGGGGGGGGGSPGTPGTPQIPEVPSAVPEPATWLMMLLGFGVIGATQRRRQTLPGAAQSA